MSRCIANFYQRAVLNNFKTKQSGVPVFDDKDYVEILFPGDRNSVIDREASEKDIIEYSAEWDRYKTGKSQLLSGMPLIEWPQIAASQIKTLEYYNVFTVEQLAAMPDSGVQNIGMGTLDLRERAKKYVVERQEIEFTSKLENKIADLEAKIQNLIAQKETTVPATTEQQSPYVEHLVRIEALEQQLTDKRGNLFDPAIHAVDDEENPIIIQGGYFKRK